MWHSYVRLWDLHKRQKFSVGIVQLYMRSSKWKYFLPCDVTCQLSIPLKKQDKEIQCFKRNKELKNYAYLNRYIASFPPLDSIISQIKTWYRGVKKNASTPFRPIKVKKELIGWKSEFFGLIFIQSDLRNEFLGKF